VAPRRMTMLAAAAVTTVALDGLVALLAAA
jgi:hypothetical protein